MERFYIQFRYGNDCGILPIIALSENWAIHSLLNSLYYDFGQQNTFTAKVIRQEPIGDRLKM